MREVETVCPFDGEHVLLTVTMDCGDEFIRVEDLNAFLDGAAASPTTQEDFTLAVRRQFRCPVETVGIHQGVTITCKA